MNVPLYPLECSLLVEKSRVDSAIAKNFIARKETKCTKLHRASAMTGGSGVWSGSTHAILDAHTNEIIVVGIDEIAHILSTIADSVPTAVYPHKNR